jgi:predicted transcriptional regulator
MDNNMKLLFELAISQTNRLEAKAEDKEMNTWGHGYLTGKAEVWQEIAERLATTYPELSERFDQWASVN